jgi:hypothetical protein
VDRDGAPAPFAAERVVIHPPVHSLERPDERKDGAEGTPSVWGRHAGHTALDIARMEG